MLPEQPELKEVIIDGTERRLTRAQHRGKQKRFYSGRKKRHAVKNVIIVGRTGSCGVRRLLQPNATIKV